MKTVTIPNAYKSFKNKNIPYSEYVKVLEDFFKFIISQVFKSYIVKLPEKFGTLQIVGVRVNPSIDKETGEIKKGLAPDWKRTRELWAKNPEAGKRKEVIYFINEHTQRVRYRIRWSKKHIFHENKDFYSFRLSRFNRRALKDLINSGSEFQILN